MSSTATTQRQALPQLPVPQLSLTIKKYIKSVEPFLNECELEHTKKLLYRFESDNGIGPKLQSLLIQRAKETDNWLAEWWLNTAYLDIRDPLAAYSSPGLVFPMEKFVCPVEQCQYAAKLIAGALSYRELIDSGKMTIDKMSKDPLDMNQYNKIFGTCRLPGLKLDSLEYNPNSKHIVIVRNNNFFKLNVLDNCGKAIGVETIIEALNEIMKQSETVGPPVGVLTCNNRNSWYKTYQNLTSNLDNLKSVNEIQKSLFLVCLDKAMPRDNHTLQNIACKQLLHGGGSTNNSANRWFDKTIQFIVSEDGIVGITYEHTPSDGQPIASMCDYIINYTRDFKSDFGSNICSKPEKLSFNVDDCIQSAINTASTNIDELVSNFELEVFKFTYFGKEFVKRQKFSPDSFIQIAMQYAFYRLHREPKAHYEAASTRKYIHGRTETIRSCSTESINFAKTMLDCQKADQEKLAVLKDAVNAHKKYSIEAVNGFGVDRHFLGLKLIAAENNLPIPEIFNDSSWTRSTHMKLLTSQVATKSDCVMFFGPCVPDGYACCYNPRANDINFAVSTFGVYSDTVARKFKEALENSLHEMHDLLVKI